MNQQELSHTLRKEIIAQGRSVQIVASGYSMFPFLRQGDLLTVEPVPMETIKRGDIVVFEIGEKWIAHRAVKISNSRNQTKISARGDSYLYLDPEVTKLNFVGIVNEFERNKTKKDTQKGLFKTWSQAINTMGITYNSALLMTRIVLRFLYHKKKSNKNQIFKG